MKRFLLYKIQILSTRMRTFHRQSFYRIWREIGVVSSGRGVLIKRLIEMGKDEICKKGEREEFLIFGEGIFVILELQDEFALRGPFNLYRNHRLNGGVRVEKSFRIACGHYWFRCGRSSAAYFLLESFKNNVEIVVYEKESRTGGRIQRIRIGDEELEAGGSLY